MGIFLDKVIVIDFFSKSFWLNWVSFELISVFLLEEKGLENNEIEKKNEKGNMVLS